MNITYRVQHRTTFNYVSDVSLSQQLLRLTPRNTAQQTVLADTILVEPAPVVRRTSRDWFGNETNFVSVQEVHRRLIVHASSSVQVQQPDWPSLDSGEGWEATRHAVDYPESDEAVRAAAFCFPSPYVDIAPGVAALVDDLFTPRRPLLEATMALTQRIFETFEYRGGVTDVWTPVATVLENRQGVCQDFAHLGIACLRSIGLPARYMSGYLLTRPPPGKERLVGADESHAWMSVWLPDFGWIDFDPTNGLMPGCEHIVLGWGRDYGDVSPINGFILGGGAHELKVSVDVAPIVPSRR